MDTLRLGVAVLTIVGKIVVLWRKCYCGGTTAFTRKIKNRLNNVLNY
jgi:hypothetical protein